MVPDFLRRVKRTAVLFCGFLYDFRRMCRHSAAVRTAGTKEKLRALIMVHCHAIEKGLAWSRAKPDFGSDRVGVLLLLLQEYAARYGIHGPHNFPRDGPSGREQHGILLDVHYPSPEDGRPG